MQHFYTWIFWLAFHIVSIQLIRSVFENCYRMGFFKEASWVEKIISTRFGQMIKPLLEPPTKNSKDA
jgi:hypothetical protein